MPLSMLHLAKPLCNIWLQTCINNSYLFLGRQQTSVSAHITLAAVNHSNDPECVWGLDNKGKFTAFGCQEAANNSSVWQVPLLKPCRSTLFLTRCYLKSVCFPVTQGEWEALIACLLISGCHLKKVPSYLKTMGGWPVGNTLLGSVLACGWKNLNSLSLPNKCQEFVLVKMILQEK